MRVVLETQPVGKLNSRRSTENQGTCTSLVGNGVKGVNDRRLEKL